MITTWSASVAANGILSGAIATLTWDRPWALWFLLLVPPAWYWLSRSPKPWHMYTGGFELWKEGPSGNPRQSRRRWVPFRFFEWLALLGLLLALAGPKQSTIRSEAPLRVIVDRSPSMYWLLPDGRTRLQAGRDRLLAELSGKRVVYVDGHFGFKGVDNPVVNKLPSPSLDLVSGPEFLNQGTSDWPIAWDLPPTNPLSEVQWRRFDQPNTWWLTDDAPIGGSLEKAHAFVPQFAGWLASGGPAQHGPVGLHQDRLLLWNGSIALVEEQAPKQWLVGGQAWPEAWVRLAGLWAQERGLHLHLYPESSEVPAGLNGGASHIALRLVSPSSDSTDVRSTTEFRFEGQGFQLMGTARPMKASFVEAADQVLWVAHSKGESFPLFARMGDGLHSAVIECDRIQGDVSSFGLEFAQMLDSARQVPKSIVPISERQAATAGKQAPPGEAPEDHMRPSNGGDRPQESPSPFTPWLSLGAALCLLAGLGSRS